MKKQVPLILLLFISFIAYSQTLYDIHDIDDCVTLVNSSSSNATTTIPTTNPDATDTANPNVTGILASANNGAAKFDLPYTIADGDEVSFSYRYYTANSGSPNNGSGLYVMRFYNKDIASSLNGANIVTIKSENKTGGSWQTVTGTVTVSTTNNVATMNSIDLIASNRAATIEEFYIDDIQLSINPKTILADTTSDLLTGNAWLYDNRAGNTKSSFSAVNATAEENIATPTTDGNSTATVLKITRAATGNPFIQMDHGKINYATAGSTKFRIYPECLSGITPSFRYFIREDGDGAAQRTTGATTLVANVWNEVTIDLSTLGGGESAGTNFNNSLIYFNFGEGESAGGSVYYLDAFQVPAATATYNGNGTDFATDTNWDTGVVPGATHNVVIPTGLASQPIIGGTTGVTVNDLTVDGSSTLNITSGGSLIVKGTSLGNVTYNLAANDTNWHLFSSPLLGATYNSTWIADNEIDDTSSATTNVAIGTYINTTDSDGDWVYATDASNSGTFNTAQGYTIKRDATPDTFISFTGAMQTADVSATITANDIGLASENRWTFIGNPFSSYINVTSLLGLAANATALENSREALYVWNGSAYESLTTGYLHPGQGFFVNSDLANTSIAINEDMLSHQTGVTLYKNAVSSPSIKLMITDGKNIKSTEINYLDGKTTDLDPRFDIGTFTGASTNFSIYSHLVSNSNSVNFMRQALPNSNFESMIIPVGVNIETVKEVTFSAEALNLPSGLKVYLEDKLMSKFIRLDEANKTYKVSLAKESNGVGRFYLHTVQEVLSLDTTLVLDHISVYNLDANTLRINGLEKGKTTVNLFNILGKQIVNSSFEASGIQDISLPKLAKGIYIVQISTDAGKLNKKIILE